ncbi:hypothetical protein K488DRAFT_73803, partial [Vararia minispora EC-137]
MPAESPARDAPASLDLAYPPSAHAFRLPFAHPPRPSYSPLLHHALHPAPYPAPYASWRPIDAPAEHILPPPPPPAQPIAHKVWILDCKTCQTFLTNRGMK